MGATAIALPCLGAMAHWQATLHRAAPARDRPVARRHYHGGGAPARPLAAQSAPRPPSRSVQRLLRRQRSSHSGPGRRMMPPPNRRVRTRTHGGGGGVELRSFPLSRSSLFRALEGLDGRDKPGQDENRGPISSLSRPQVFPDRWSSILGLALLSNALHRHREGDRLHNRSDRELAGNLDD